MNICGRVLFSLLLLTPFVLGTGSLAAEAPVYPVVTDQRLQNPTDGEWLLYRRTYDSWGYSPLDQITTDNVSKLEPLWTFSTGVNEAHQAPPLVNGRYMLLPRRKITCWR